MKLYKVVALNPAEPLDVTLNAAAMMNAQPVPVEGTRGMTYHDWRLVQVMPIGVPPVVEVYHAVFECEA